MTHNTHLENSAVFADQEPTVAHVDEMRYLIITVRIRAKEVKRLYSIIFNGYNDSGIVRGILRSSNMPTIKT